ncbi:hypothetical protein HYH03_008321 [Edaphochlamys debaryana]|uniref:tRNA pseudouridine(55) synthase n=1 Tax=Edaphochlamys debaryana TaxID=47281 RepID=A0A835Y6T2_9CHLO|nr:hypothetical protein HYH03_008321 [Edaphochlamys debaryana]|eukprot:KAG2493505.1 hypothetical protein HYH03_008321 [Edaphochlamys debaryana]
MTSFPEHLSPAVLSNGLLLVDKPPDWQVQEVVASVRRASGAARLASLAPLDACASGLLLIAFGAAASTMAARVEAAPKRYEGTVRLGAASNTFDVRGDSYVPYSLPCAHVTDEDIADAAASMASGPSTSAAPEGGPSGAQANAGVRLVLPERHRLRALPGAAGRYLEEDAGGGIRTSPLRVLDFRAWRCLDEAPASGAPGRESGSCVSVGFSMQIAGRGHVRSLLAMYGRRLRTSACLEELRRTAVGGLEVADAWALEALLPALERYGRE